MDGVIKKTDLPLKHLGMKNEKRHIQLNKKQKSKRLILSLFCNEQKKHWRSFKRKRIEQKKTEK